MLQIKFVTHAKFYLIKSVSAVYRGWGNVDARQRLFGASGIAFSSVILQAREGVHSKFKLNSHSIFICNEFSK
jgi:hypothetical protein